MHSALFEKHYAKQFDKNTKIYEGISQVLTFLQVKEIKMAVLSNKPNAFVLKCVMKYLRDWKFDAIYGTREGVERKPSKEGVLEILKELNIDANESIFVGDTKVDMLTAKNANVDSIGVLWGFRERKELEDHGAKFIVEDPKEIIKLVDSLNK